MSTQKTNACLFLAALIWGLAFVAQQMGMDLSLIHIFHSQACQGHWPHFHRHSL